MSVPLSHPRPVTRHGGTVMITTAKQSCIKSPISTPVYGIVILSVSRDTNGYKACLVSSVVSDVRRVRRSGGTLV